jgi:plasmid maintenance system killer protein
MKLSYKNNKEEKLYQSEKALSSKYGAQRARKIIQRLSEIVSADNPQMLPHSARFHEHSGNRKGLFSVDIGQPYRLIFKPMCKYTSWVEITELQVFEVMDPH